MGLFSTLLTATMLSQTSEICRHYEELTSRLPPPTPQYERYLPQASLWFSLDLERLANLSELESDALWGALKEIGVQGVHLIGLKEGHPYRTSFALNPRLSEEDYQKIRYALEKRGLLLMGDLVGDALGLGPDFATALTDAPGAPALFHLVEVPEGDWSLLPPIARGTWISNVPWLSLQELRKRGLVPEAFTPYTKESDWNATAPVTGGDQKERRWIYLKEGRGAPRLNWLSATCGALRLATADALDSFYRLGIPCLTLGEGVEESAQKTLSLWVDKLGGSAIQPPLKALSKLTTLFGDFAFEEITRPALLHALLTEEAEALSLIYQLLFAENVALKRLVHTLQPFDTFSLDWEEFLQNPKKHYRYYEERITGEALRSRLLRDDVARFFEPSGKMGPLHTTMSCCSQALSLFDLLQGRELLTQAHLLLAFFYAMQPGLFSFSEADLLGALPEHLGQLKLLDPNTETLYPSLPTQMGAANSFARRLQAILRVRRDAGLSQAKGGEVLKTKNRSTLLLTFEREGDLFLLAVNFGRKPVRETVESLTFRERLAIDLMRGKQEPKPLSSPQLLVELPPLSGKIFSLQRNYTG